MHTLSLYISKKKILKLLLITGIFVILSTLILIDGKADSAKMVVFPWLGIVFFGSGFVFLIYKYFDHKPQVNIDKYGIWKQYNQEEKLYWEQIKAIEINEAHSNYFVRFNIDSSIHNKKGKQIKSLNISPLNVDKTAFVTLLNNLIQSKEEQRYMLIQAFKNEVFTTSVTSKNTTVSYTHLTLPTKA